MKISNVISFVLGAAVGGFGVYYYLNKIYEKRIQDELDSIHTSFDDYLNDKKPETEEKEPLFKVETGIAEKAYSKYAKTIENYTNYSNSTVDNVKNIPTENPTSNMLNEDTPDVEYITPDEFGEIDDYDEVFYTYFEDDILIEGAIRNDDFIIDHPEKTIGTEYKDHIGEYEDITLLGVNHRLQQYFEVTFVDEKYNEEE